MRHDSNNVSHSYLLEKELFSVVYKNLDEIILNSKNIEEIKDNIKLFTYYYLLESEQLFISENVFRNMSDTIKTTFWDTTLGLWSGKISMTNWLSGVGFKAVSSGGKIGFSTLGTSAMGEALLKLQGAGASIGSASGVLGTIASRALFLRIASLAIFPTVLLGLLIYRLISFKDIYVIKNFESTLKATIDRLRLSKTADFKNDYKNLNKKYNNILKSNCANISDKEQRLKCASNYYIKYMTEDLLVKLINNYVLLLKKQKLDISYIYTFQDLAQFQFGRSNDYKQLSMLYKYYIRMLDVYEFNNKKSYYIKLLDKTVINSINSKERGK